MWWYHLLVACLAIVSLMTGWYLVQRWALRRGAGAPNADGLAGRMGCGSCQGGGCHCGSQPNDNKPEQALRTTETGQQA